MYHQLNPAQHNQIGKEGEILRFRQVEVDHGLKVDYSWMRVQSGKRPAIKQ
ncbi:MAG: hypothetical protein ACM3UW_06925 [Bacillota bacterium]